VPSILSFEGDRPKDAPQTDRSPTPANAPPERHLIVARRNWARDSGDPSRCVVTLQVFNSDGSACGPEITVDAAVEDNLFHPAIAALADGRFALAREEAMEADASAGLVLRVQIFNADGSRWEPAAPISTEIAAD
jgi:hypothetical protein